MSESTRSTPEGPAPFEFTAPLTVCVDVTHPLAYLAFGPVQATAAAIGVAVDWLPFTAPPLKGPPEAGPQDDRGTRHRRARALYQASEIERYAGAQGRALRDPFRAVAPLTAALGHLWLRHRAPQQVTSYLATLLDARWSQDRDIETPRAVAAILEDLGHDAEDFAAFAARTGPAELAELRGALVAAGVFTVPSLVVENEVFVGRAHLPVVRWILGGRVGPGPV